MKKITISEAQINTSPNPISLICVKAPNGTTNLTPISWWTYLSNHPPIIGFAISKKSYTGKLLLRNGQAVLSIPGSDIANKVLGCGHISGRDINKPEHFNIPLVKSEIDYPCNSKLVFECQLTDTINVSDHIFYICKVHNILLSENEKQLYAWEGYSKLKPID